MARTSVLVFASGSAEGGGSGFQELVENARSGILDAEVVAVVSQYPNGGVRKRADALGIPFIHFPKGGGRAAYDMIRHDTGADFLLLSGWVLLTQGLDPQTTVNIHPGPLPRFGGKGMYGHHVHEAVIAAHRAGTCQYSAVTMHFVTPEYDRGPIFFSYPVLIREGETAEQLAGRVNKIEHGWQSWATNLVTTRQITWDGVNPSSLRVPEWYSFHIPKE